IHIGTIILVSSPEPGTLSILQRPHSDAPASRTLPTTACQSHGSIDWPCQIYNISHFILSTLLYKNSEGHIHCQRVNFCMSSGECVHTVLASNDITEAPCPSSIYLRKYPNKKFTLSFLHLDIPLFEETLIDVPPLCTSQLPPQRRTLSKPLTGYWSVNPALK